ncbi:hypothetical protein [Paenibacillus sp. L3-i20]|uniref:hypothetical protein n=1 Tax=Paenibacillus sp. L3-i20 TaxID=2905833 RepID=UPI001EDD04D7|nr:hypothetical protein [Paenibacillus sp. L3-i20]GKU76857.1 hypothetical protein L3i20_v212540 [Paenibacillus sp. L3-i20]
MKNVIDTYFKYANGDYTATYKYNPVKVVGTEKIDQVISVLSRIRELSLQESPCKELALLCGIRDISFETFHYGLVESYTGIEYIQMADGTIWKVEGHKGKGSNDGFISFDLIDIQQIQKEFMLFFESINYNPEWMEEIRKIAEVIDQCWLVIPRWFWEDFSSKANRMLLFSLPQRMNNRELSSFYNWKTIEERIKKGELVMGAEIFSNLEYMSLDMILLAKKSIFEKENEFILQTHEKSVLVIKENPSSGTSSFSPVKIGGGRRDNSNTFHGVCKEPQDQNNNISPNGG